MFSISIIIPIFGVENYVQRCLESVMVQDINDIEVECVIIDDCTPDNSMVIVRRLISSYHGSIRFKLLSHENNRGIPAARNTGISNASGDYIFFVDSDDYLMPNCFQYFKDNMKQYPEVDMVLGNAKNCKDGENFIHHIQNAWLIDDCNVFFQRMLRHQIYLYAWNRLIRRELLINNNIFFEEGIIYEDQSWSYELFSHISSILLLPEVTYIYENNPLSLVNTSFTIERSDLVLKSYTISVNKLFDKPPVPTKYKRNLTVDYLLFMMYYLMNGIDVQSRYPVSDANKSAFRRIRLMLFGRSLKYGRLILSCFFLLLFPPFRYFQKMRLLRRYYYEIDASLNRFCHLFDFLHNKDRI